MNIYFRDMGSVCCVTCFNIDYENVRKVLSDLSKYLWVGEHKYTPVKGNKFGAPMNERFSDKISESYRRTLFTRLFDRGAHPSLTWCEIKIFSQVGTNT